MVRSSFMRIRWQVLVVFIIIIAGRGMNVRAAHPISCVSLHPWVIMYTPRARPMPEGMVRIKGELWRAKSASGRMDTGEEVTVVRQDGLKLIVRKRSPGDLEGTE